VSGLHLRLYGLAVVELSDGMEFACELHSGAWKLLRQGSGYGHAGGLGTIQVCGPCLVEVKARIGALPQ